jgi:hypothetical protein
MYDNYLPLVSDIHKIFLLKRPMVNYSSDFLNHLTKDCKIVVNIVENSNILWLNQNRLNSLFLFY